MEVKASHAGNYKALIINVALTGIVPPKAKYANLPVTPEEIGQDVLQCFELGARVFHLHMRDKNDRPVQDSRLFAETIGVIRERTPDAILCVTTSSRASSSLEDRFAPLLLEGKLRPDFGSLSAGSFNFPDTVSVNSPSDIKALLETMKQKGVRPEIEVFEPGMVDYVKTLISDGMVTAPYVFNILLGSVGASSADLLSLVNFLSKLPDESEWALAGIGRYQLPMIVQAIVAGGNVRVGMEDSPRQIGIDSWSNAKAVSFATETASLLGRPIATPSEVRERLGVGRA